GRHNGRGGRKRSGKFRRIYRDVRLHVIQLVGGLSVSPGQTPLERHLHSSHLTVIGVVNLDGNGTNDRLAVSHDSGQQRRFRVKKQFDTTAAGHRLHDLNRAIVDCGGRETCTPVREGLFQPTWKGKMRGQLDPVQTSSRGKG